MPYVRLDWTTWIVQRQNNRVLQVRLLNGVQPPSLPVMVSFLSIEVV